MCGNGRHQSSQAIQDSNQDLTNTMTSGSQTKKSYGGDHLERPRCQYGEAIGISSGWMRDGCFRDLDVQKTFNFWMPALTKNNHFDQTTFV